MKKSRMPIRKWSSGRGTLILIAALFSASALIRLGGGYGQAIAKEVSSLTSPTTHSVDNSQCKNSEEIGEILDALNVREALLKKRETKLEEFQQTLALAEDQIEKNIEALITAEQNLAAAISHSETAAEADLARLTAVYENMKPKEAATVFEEMNPEFAAGFIGRMRPDAAAALMAGLTPQTAYSVSVILAGRNANVPTK
jgi:flagellar motility protein MotE (MotC chaperone)